MIVCGVVLGFVKASLARCLVVGELRGKEFQRNGSFESGVLGLRDDAHAALAEVLEDLVVGNNLADHGNLHGRE